jgi:hypothetical protein
VLPNPDVSAFAGIEVVHDLELRLDTGTMTSCAIRSKGSIVNVDWPRFQHETINWPW